MSLLSIAEITVRTPNIIIVDSYKIECIQNQLEIIDIILEYTNEFPAEGWDRDRRICYMNGGIIIICMY